MTKKVAPEVPENVEPEEEYENPFLVGLIEQIRNTILNRSHNAHLPVVKVMDLPDLDAQKLSKKTKAQ